MKTTPTISYGDSYTLGQLAKHWQKSTRFVDRMISEGKIVVDEGGVVTNAALRNFLQGARHRTGLTSPRSRLAGEDRAEPL